MKKIIMLVVALLLVGGIGAGAYFYLNNPAEASADATDDVVKGKEAKAKKELTEQEKLEADAKVAFVKMDPLTLPVIDKSGVVQVINIVVTLEAVNPEIAKEIERFAPRLKDAYIQGMYGALSKKTSMDSAGVLNIDAVKEKLNKITTKVLGEDKVNNVLIQAVQQRKA
jgi:flagellar FliL protein